jgi:hypothetical protein
MSNEHLTSNEWPVHFLETTGSKDLAALTDLLRKQTTVTVRSSPRIKQGVGKWLAAIYAESKFLRKALAVHKSSLAPRSGQLWAGSAMVTAISAILESGILKDSTKEAHDFGALWDRLPTAIPALGEYLEGRVKAFQLREESILSQASTLHALAIVLALLTASQKAAIDHALEKLGNFDWSRVSQTTIVCSRIQLREERTQLLLDLCRLEQPQA